MQFFIIGVALTVLFHNQFRVMCGVLFLMITGSLVATGVIVYQNNIQALSLTNPGSYQNDIYDKPYTRIPSYLIGMFVAFLFTKTSVRIKTRPVIAICTVLVFACTFIPCYTFWGELTPVLSGWNATQNTLYITFSRPCWTLGVAILTYMCICDVGGVFDWFLSLGFWDPLAKLSYSAYLIHPIVMRVFYFNKRYLFFWSPMEYAYYYVANLVISYSLAVVIYCAVETPFAALEKVVGSLGKKGKRERRG
jgi:peptidoglycan/LPS O-acetylase OafA/YrhL